LANNSDEDIYAVIRREFDDYYLSNITGNFEEDPVSKYVPLTEDDLLKKVYALEESRSEWDDGSYFIAIYLQIEGSPDLENDVLIGGATMWIKDDLEVNLKQVADDAEDSITIMESLSEGTGPTPHVYTVYVDGVPQGDVHVIMTSDVAGEYRIHQGRTNANGQITFYPDLPAGTKVYMWSYKTGVLFTNPDEEVL